MLNRAQALLETTLGAGANFRSGQWEAIETVAVKKGRVLVVQRTGWGKSLVYFLATKLLREQGSGPTLLISPLLSLMRNQIQMAEKIGISALTINSTNKKEWESIENKLRRGKCDILLISPERLSNERFLNNVLSSIAGRVGLFVVDEAHCISDWGHDFRPDYRRITRIIQRLPRGVPVLGTTATANDRVIADVQAQLGAELKIMRGPLARDSLRLQNIQLADQSERFAWLAENLLRLPGSGVVYCLTVADTQRVARWLLLHDINAEAYHAGDDANLDREALEQALIDNDIKVLVSTVALGMGFDKPDLGFVIHFQRPGSVIGYYQQVGRAGRAVDQAYGILLSGVEDDEIQEYFINSAFPSANMLFEILDVLESEESLSLNELMNRVNISQSMLEKSLKLLEIDEGIGKSYEGSIHYFRTLNPWQPDFNRIEQVTNLRKSELDEMRTYVRHSGCLMEFLCRALDDPRAAPCGKCANCQGRGFSSSVNRRLVADAVEFLKRDELIISPRKRWPLKGFFGSGRKIPQKLRNEQGRALCDYGDSGYGPLVRNGKYQDGKFSDGLVLAAKEFIANRWSPDPFPTWVTAIPSHRHPILVRLFAESLAGALGIDFFPVLIKIKDTPEQKTMANSAMQARNVQGTLAISGEVPKGSVLLVDDIVDSRWTLTLAGYMLRKNGSGPVFPFTLARATARKS